LRLEQTTKEISSTKSNLIKESEKGDSLSALIRISQLREKQVDLEQDELRSNLVSSTKEIAEYVQRLPPLVVTQIGASLSLLQHELTTKSVDNIEGMTRLFQIFSQIDEVLASIQISQESSPVPEIRGTVYRLRIGAFFEAVVDIKGEKGALWQKEGEKNGSQWKVISDPEISTALLKAINMREGKAIPTFIGLPLAGLEEKDLNK
jgi:hypothetical protein